MRSLIYFILFVITYSSAQAQSWVKDKEKDGITIWTKTDPKYRMRASKAEMYTSASVDKVVDAVFNVKNYIKWMPDCQSVTVLKKVSDVELIYHGLYGVPWPAVSRDIVLNIKKVAIEGGYKIIMTNKSNYIEVRSDAVRVPIYFGEWRITKTSKGTYVVIEYQTDPGGSVPDWMIQGASTKNPFDMFISLKSYIK